MALRHRVRTRIYTRKQQGGDARSTANDRLGSEAEVTNTQNHSMRTAATWCKVDIVTQELSRSRSLGAR